MLSLRSVRDEDLLRQLCQLVKQSRGVEAEVVAHVGEVERRRLHAREACSSMFEYCRRVLGMRENEAYLRITVARAARENPVLLDMLRDGRLHLSGIARLAPHLTRENSDAVLDRASGMSHREIRELVAELEPRPDVAPTIRKLPERPARPVNGSVLQSDRGSQLQADASFPPPGIASPLRLGTPRVESTAVKAESRVAAPATAPLPVDPTRPASPAFPARPALVEPLAPGRYLVRFTASVELRDKLERLQALMRSAVPDGDLAHIIEIAVSEKLQRVEAKRFGQTKTPRAAPAGTDKSAGTHEVPSSRHIPATVRRFVYERDRGRCAYRDKYGRRCGKRHNLEFHHRHPFALGGGHGSGNLTLMCRAHNRLLAEGDYGEAVMERFRATSRAGVPLDTDESRGPDQRRGVAWGFPRGRPERSP